MIQLEHISKNLKENRTKWYFLHIWVRKIYGIYGINGSGKTMLLRIISVWFSRLPAQ